MTDVRVGDTVRVVLEGEVKGADGATFTVGQLGEYSNVVRPTSEHVKSVEVVKRRQPKVGDTVRANALDVFTLPVGTVLSYKSQLRDAKFQYFKTYNGWKNTDGFESYMTSGCDLTVEYIPS